MSTSTIADELRRQASSTGREQRVQALDRANEIRLARAELRRRIGAGHPAARVILHTPPEALTWSVAQVLLAQRRWGITRTRNMLSRLGIPETKYLGTLTERQRRMLSGALGGSTAAGEGEGRA